ncbi:MAG: type II toxin-antitoxin system Phd/YefM family antitoxin [Candidatus Solibacter usitatus]|nr:type II toxin-antitoxin system Phd/YefM family antitoxin [Candidatus Solibacter usitatus]
MKSWPVQDAKARFSEMLNRTLADGPQLVTRRGVETVVLVPFSEWRQLKASARPALKDLLLAPQPRFDWGSVLPVRKRAQRRRLQPFA